MGHGLNGTEGQPPALRQGQRKKLANAAQHQNAVHAAADQVLVQGAVAFQIRLSLCVQQRNRRGNGGCAHAAFLLYSSPAPCMAESAWVV